MKGSAAMRTSFRPGNSASAFDRRTLLKVAALGCARAVWPLPLSLAESPSATPAPGVLLTDLLKDWCEGLLRQQIVEPSNPARHGALRCPACGFLHGRAGDSVYPFLYMARKTGEPRFLEAAIAAVEWTRNVDAPDGAWTNELDPKSWKGITVFGAIALGEALHRHGDLLDAKIRERWTTRLRRAADYIHRTFDMQTGNINYGMTGTYALALLGRILEEPRYTDRARQMAAEARAFFTVPNQLLFGEGRPNKPSARGCLPVDLGYNVEESLPALALYGLLEKDETFLQLVTQSLAAHLEFMLPDGAWDNSWGTRNYKWTYWGSRTSDGCATAYALLADRHPAFGAAAVRNTQLLHACTSDGLLYGGPHYRSRGLQPCIHHTFTHAKALTTVLDHAGAADKLRADSALPREAEYGVREFPEIATCLAALGPWRATVTAYDWLYQNKVFHATGGALALLWHRELGPLCVGSLAEYSLVEAHNMQPNPDPRDISLTPRVEISGPGGSFTNLFDLKATVTHKTAADAVEFHVQTQLVDKKGRPPQSGAVPCEVTYRFDREATTLTLRTAHPDPHAAGLALALPIVSARAESLTRRSQAQMELQKKNGTLVIQSNVPLTIPGAPSERIFNNVPGFEAVPFSIPFPPDFKGSIECRLSRKA